MTSRPGTSPSPSRSTQTQDDRFERDTAVQLVEGGIFSARIDKGWWVMRGPNGGYIAAIIQRAVSQAVGDPDRTPRSLTVHYTSPPVEGDALIETRLERQGRSLSTVTARLTQGGRLRALALAALSTPRMSHEFHHAAMPNVPGPEGLAVAESMIPIHARYECRFIPEMSPQSGSDVAVTAAWIRAREPRPLDHALIAAYTDALPPALFARARNIGEFGALPTVDLTIHYRMDPADAGVGPSDACLAIFRSRLAHRGYIEEDGEIWSPRGQLLAQSRQLAVILG
jgi:acyl-CoA thioesterase